LLLYYYKTTNFKRYSMPEGSTFAEKYDVHEALNRF
jgi:hypothetical protein